MDDARRSTTAERAAMLRALHQLIDDPRVFDDPIVIRLLSPEHVARLRTDPTSLDTPGARSLRAFIAVRSRFAEDVLHAAGVEQYVVLGAGLDTFAYRTPHPEGLRVFEVDHPATQAWKRERLATAGIVPPPNVELVAFDFERQSLAEALATTGFDPRRPACVSWLGVTVYLTVDAIRGTLAWVASLPSGSTIVFEYAVPSASSDAGAQIRAGMAARSAAVGEPWITFFEPDEMARMLAAAGFTDVEDLDPEAAYQRYFRNRQDGLRPRGTARLVRATVRDVRATPAQSAD
ncbi:MAG TPA: class I SAM-dependent methyltransferase [Candidatus Binatia bacterium]|jgi:methyltransferase (TIGR00027 family)|nr:class I SAM-dependent methyltransferase [Candidatus Binatia bacterium]